jgi:hypothetical protein
MTAPAYQTATVALRDGARLALDIHDFSPPWQPAPVNRPGFPGGRLI